MTQMSSHHSIGFHFSSDLSYLTLKGAGRHIIDSHDYSWDNRNRSGDYCLVQCCIGGEGALEMKGISYSLLPGDVFLIAIPGESRYYLPAHAQYWDAPYLEFSKECLPLLRKIYGSIGPVIHLTQESGLIDRMLSIYDRALHHDWRHFLKTAKPPTRSGWISPLTPFHAITGKSRKSITPRPILTKTIARRI